MRLAFEFLKRAFFELEDILFEKRHGFDFSGTISRQDLNFENKDSLNHATAYHAVWCRNLRVLMWQAQKLGLRYENFIDIGSGKGKACFYAKKLGFSNVFGIEFSDDLIRVAEKNKEKTHASNVKFIRSDACVYLLPSKDNFVFLFNPFDEVVLDRFIKNNIAHFNAYNSVLAYANDVHQGVLSNYGFKTIFKDELRRISIHKVTTQRAT